MSEKTPFKEPNERVEEAIERNNEISINYDTGVIEFSADVKLHIDDPSTLEWKIRDKSEWWCPICDKGPMTKSGLKTHQSRVHNLDNYRYECIDDYDNVPDIEELSDDTLRAFLKIRGARIGERKEMFGKAIEKYFIDKASNRQELFYHRSKHVSDDINGLFSPKQLASGFIWLDDNDDSHSLEIERYSKSNNLWKVRVP